MGKLFWRLSLAAVAVLAVAAIAVAGSNPGREVQMSAPGPPPGSGSLTGKGNLYLRASLRVHNAVTATMLCTEPGIETVHEQERSEVARALERPLIEGPARSSSDLGEVGDPEIVVPACASVIDPDVGQLNAELLRILREAEARVGATPQGEGARKAWSRCMESKLSLRVGSEGELIDWEQVEIERRLEAAASTEPFDHVAVAHVISEVESLVDEARTACEDRLAGYNRLIWVEADRALAKRPDLIALVDGILTPTPDWLRYEQAQLP